jgi:hypothetical protein
MNIDLLTTDIMVSILPFIPVEHREDVAELIKEQCEKHWNEFCSDESLDAQFNDTYHN